MIFMCISSLKSIKKRLHSYYFVIQKKKKYRFYYDLQFIGAHCEYSPWT